MDSEESLFPAFAVTEYHLVCWGVFDTAHLSANAKAVGVFLDARFCSRVILCFKAPDSHVSPENCKNAKYVNKKILYIFIIFYILFTLTHH